MYKLYLYIWYMYVQYQFSVDTALSILKWECFCPSNQVVPWHDFCTKHQTARQTLPLASRTWPAVLWYLPGVEWVWGFFWRGGCKEAFTDFSLFWSFDSWSTISSDVFSLKMTRNDPSGWSVLLCMSLFRENSQCGGKPTVWTSPQAASGCRPWQTLRPSAEPRCQVGSFHDSAEINFVWWQELFSCSTHTHTHKTPLYVDDLQWTVSPKKHFCPSNHYA